MEKLEPSYNKGGNIKQSGTSSKGVIWANDSTSWYIPKRNQNIHSHKTYIEMFIVALFLIVKNRNNPGYQLMMNFKMWYIHKRLFSHWEEWNTDLCYTVNEFRKYYAKWNKPVTKDHILYDSIYMRCPGQANLLGQKEDCWLPRNGAMKECGGEGGSDS